MQKVQLPPDYSLKLEIADKDDPKKTHTISGWQSYTVVEDWFKGVPTFKAVPAATAEMRDLIGPHSQRVRIFADNDAYQFDGFTDERAEDTSMSATTMDIVGRGVAAQLVDCSIPIEYRGDKLLNCNGMTLFQVVERTSKPWRDAGIITDIVADAGPSRYIVAGAKRKVTKIIGAGHWDVASLKKDPPVLKWVDVEFTATSGGRRGAVGKKSPYYKGTDRDALKNEHADPGTTPFALWRQLAKQVRAHVWSAGDGTIIVGMPCYQMDPAGAYGRGIWLHWDKRAGRATDSNVMGAQVETGGAERFSEYVVHGVSKPNKKARGKQLIGNGWTVYDPSPGFWKRQLIWPYLAANKLYRPKIIPVKGLKDPKFIKRTAMYKMEELAIKGISIEYELPGHHAPNGNLWTIDSMVEVHDERNNIFGPHYIIRVERRYQGIGNPPKGRTSLLKMIPPDVFMPTKQGNGTDFDPDTISDDAYLEHMMHRIWW